MPVGTVSQTTERKELKSLPPVAGEDGGYVVLKKLSYGQILLRRDMSSKMIMEQRARRKGRNADSDDVQKVEMELMQEVTRLYEFANCIVEHNITDAAGQPLDFSKQVHIKALSPQVGQEIETYIDEMNRELTEDEEEDFTRLVGSSSESATS